MVKSEWILGNKALRVASPPATQGLVHSWPTDHGSQPFTTTRQRRDRAHTRSRATELIPRSLGQVFTSVSLSFLIGNLGVRTDPHSKCKLCYRCSKMGTPTSFVHQPPKQLNTQPNRLIHTQFPPCANHRTLTGGGESQRKVCKTVWPGVGRTVWSHYAFTFTTFGAGPRVHSQQ